MQLVDFANTAVRDDTIVREGGKGPSLVHLHDTNYPSCRRVTMGACYKTLAMPAHARCWRMCVAIHICDCKAALFDRQPAL